MDLNYLKTNNLILFSCISGSHAYGLNIATSDKDERGVFILPEDMILQTPLKKVEQINESNNDVTYYELGRFLQLLENNNPNILELLNIPEDCIIYKHPLFDEILQHKKLFLTKKCEMTFAGYGIDQIKKARGLNKKITKNFSEKRKSILEFSYITNASLKFNTAISNNGSLNFYNWLIENKFDQNCFGLTSIDHMRDCYYLYYDKDNTGRFKGIADDDSNDVKLSETLKDDYPFAIFYFNKDQYSVYCREHKEYWSWVKNRNESRYENNQKIGKGYDTKNMMHCFRCIRMAKEIATTNEIQVRRKDRDFLLSIRNGEHEYENLINIAEQEIDYLKVVYANSNLPSHVDSALVSNLLLTIRKKFYQSK